MWESLVSQRGHALGFVFVVLLVGCAALLISLDFCNRGVKMMMDHDQLVSMPMQSMLEIPLSSVPSLGAQIPVQLHSHHIPVEDTDDKILNDVMTVSTSAAPICVHTFMYIYTHAYV